MPSSTLSPFFLSLSTLDLNNPPDFEHRSYIQRSWKAWRFHFSFHPQLHLRSAVLFKYILHYQQRSLVVYVHIHSTMYSASQVGESGGSTVESRCENGWDDENKFIESKGKKLSAKIQKRQRTFSSKGKYLLRIFLHKKSSSFSPPFSHRFKLLTLQTITKSHTWRHESCKIRRGR